MNDNIGFAKRNSETSEVEFSVTMSKRVQVSVSDIAQAFWEMDADQQAEFFNILGGLDGFFRTQMDSVKSSLLLSLKGRDTMQAIGDFED